LAAETNKSAITDHVAKENHGIDWSGAKMEGWRGCVDLGRQNMTQRLHEYCCSSLFCQLVVRCCLYVDVQSRPTPR